MEEGPYMVDYCISYIQYSGLVRNYSNEAGVLSDLHVIPKIQSTYIQYKQWIHILSEYITHSILYQWYVLALAHITITWVVQDLNLRASSGVNDV